MLRRWTLPLLIVLLAFGLRVHALDDQSLWNDEGNSLRLAQRPVPDLIDAAGRDIHPPGYYLLLKAWTGAAGESEFSLRALSALMGVLTVAVTLALGRALFGRGASALAALLVAINAFAVYYSQETRMYAQLALVAALSMWAFVGWLRAVQRGSRGRWGWGLLLALATAAGLYTQYSFPFTLLAQGVLLLAWLGWQWQTGPGRRAALPRIVVSYGAIMLLALALFAPWLPTAWDQVTTWPRTGDDTALLDQLRAALTWTLYGNTTDWVPDLMLLYPLALGALAFIPRSSENTPQRLADAWRAALPVIWALIVIGALIVSGAYRAANLKFLLPAQVALALLIGGGLARFYGWLLALRVSNATDPDDIPLDRGDTGPARGEDVTGFHFLTAFVVGTLLALLLPRQIDALDRLYANPDYARADYRAMAARIEAAARPGDAVILNAPNQLEVFSYYYDGDAAVYPLPRGLGGDDAQTRAEVETVLSEHRRLFVLFWGEAERDPNRVVQATLDSGAYPVASEWVGDVRFAQYAVLDPAPDTPQTTTDVSFGLLAEPLIALDGYTLTPPDPRPGDVLGVTLFWRALQRPPIRYGVSVQLLGPDGALIAQHDAEPANNRAPTTTWGPGETITDPHGVVLPPDLPPGVYSVNVILYDITDPQTRLRANVGGDPVGGTLPLASVAVE